MGEAKTRVAVTSRSFSRHPVLREELQARYDEVTFNDAGRSLVCDDLIAFLDGHDKAIVALEPITEEIVAKLPRLKILAKYGVGLDTIDMAVLRRYGIKLGWTGGVNRRAVAELTLVFAISLLRQVPQANRLIMEGGWQPVMGVQLSGKTVGIVGLGHVGKDLVRLLQPFDCRILAHDIKTFPNFCQAFGVVPCGLDLLLRQSDVVTLHVPLDDTTRSMFGAAEFGRMKPGAILINTARGGLVDEAALKRALMEQRLAGAALDVFTEEPPNDTELLALPNFLATPHIGGSAREAVLAMGRAAIEGLENAREARYENFF